MMAPTENENETKESIIIFDTNIFLKGLDFNVIKSEIYTVPEVLDEIKVERYLKKNRTIIDRIHCAIESQKLILKSANEEYVRKVVERSKITNDFIVLSDVDIKLIALALEFKQTSNKKIVLYTNDYSMENLCLELNISFSPLYKEGIIKKKLFEIFCPFCKIQKNLNEQICEICGSKLKRRTKENSKNTVNNR